MSRSLVLWCLLGFAVGNLFQVAVRSVNPNSPLSSAEPKSALKTEKAAVGGTLRADQWRWATDKEAYDVYVPTACPQAVIEHSGEKAACERGIAPWRLGPSNKEKRDRDIEWVRVQSERPFWRPARSDLDPARIVIFDGMELHMVPVPAGGKGLGTIQATEAHR